jgi:hypothetical protein
MTTRASAYTLICHAGFLVSEFSFASDFSMGCGRNR